MRVDREKHVCQSVKTRVPTEKNVCDGGDRAVTRTHHTSPCSLDSYWQASDQVPDLHHTHRTHLGSDRRDPQQDRLLGLEIGESETCPGKDGSRQSQSVLPPGNVLVGQGPGRC